MAAVLLVWFLTGFTAYKTILTRPQRNKATLAVMLFLGPFTYAIGILYLLFQDTD